jgi:hypothetical protein
MYAIGCTSCLSAACGRLFLRPFHGNGKGVSMLLTTFILSILAGVIANYISRWLDERANGNKPER